MTLAMKEFVTLHERERAVSTDEYLLNIAALPAQTPSATDWGTLWAFGNEGIAVVSLEKLAEQFTWVDPIEEMRMTIAQLGARVDALETEVQMLRASAQEEVIVLRTVSREQAKEEIRHLFTFGETLYFSDVAERLRLDLPLVVELCQELIQEEDIEVDRTDAV